MLKSSETKKRFKIFQSRKDKKTNHVPLDISRDLNKMTKICRIKKNIKKHVEPDKSNVLNHLDISYYYKIKNSCIKIIKSIIYVSTEYLYIYCM